MCFGGAKYPKYSPYYCVLEKAQTFGAQAIYQFVSLPPVSHDLIQGNPYQCWHGCDPDVMSAEPQLMIYGMLSALLAAGTWLMIASVNGWPVSTTHSIVGAIVGFAAVGISVDAVHWGKVGTIVASWVVSPVLAGTISFGLFISVKSIILDSEDPFHRAKKYIPIYMWMVGFMISMVTLLKGLKHVDLDLDLGLGSDFANAIPISFGIGLLVAALGMMLMRGIKDVPDDTNRFASVERVFGVLMVFTACAMAFAHGSNDVANAVGPLAAIASTVQSGGEIVAKSAVPWWILMVGALGIVLGLATYGWRVILTVGSKITELTPSRGFAAELGASATVVIASGTGLPISTTHTLVGAVLGVGFARGIGALNLRVIGTIFVSWLVTLPAGAGLAILFFFLFKWIFGA